MSHMATNKVKGNFYCTSYFLLFVLVSFYGSIQEPKQQTKQGCTFRLQVFTPFEEINEVDQ